MTYTWQDYQEKLTVNNTDSFPFDLKDTYSTTTKYKKSTLNFNGKIDKRTEDVLFIAETLKKEVLSGTKKQQQKNLKQLKKLFLKFTMIALTVGVGTSLGMTLLLPDTVSAATNLIPTATDQPPIDINPKTIMEWGLMISLIIVAVGIALAISMFAIVGIYLMLTKKKEEAISWNSDIVKGLVMVIVAIPLVFSIFQLAQSIFANLPFLSGLM